MGRGDKRTAKGKRFKGSFGVSRPHKVTATASAAKPAGAAKAEAKPKAAAKKKAAPKKKEE